MKMLAFSLIAALAGVFSDRSQAVTVVENDLFVMSFMDEENWGANVDNAAVERIAQDTIDYWGSLLSNYSLVPDNRINITLQFKELSGTTFATGLPKFVETYGGTIEGTKQTYSISPTPIAKLLHGQTISGNDITIEVNNKGTYHYGEASSGFLGKDFHSILLHELTHGMGFLPYQYKPNGSGGWTTGWSASPYDALINHYLNGGSLTPGKHVELGDTGYVLFNPDPISGSGLSHLDEDFHPDSLMNRSFDSGEAIRTLGDAEIAVFQAMGMDLEIMPEPSTAVLVLLLTPAYLLRRRRAVV